MGFHFSTAARSPMNWFTRSTSRSRQPRFRPRLESVEDRTVLNNRFIVPFNAAADDVTNFHTLSAALNPAGLASGNVIEIEWGSMPGSISNATMGTALNATGGNLTIRGNPAIAASELPAVSTSDSIVVNKPNLTLQNLNLALAGGNLVFQSGATGSRVLNSVINNYFAVAATHGAIEVQTTGFVMNGSTVTSYAGGFSGTII